MILYRIERNEFVYQIHDVRAGIIAEAGTVSKDDIVLGLEPPQYIGSPFGCFMLSCITGNGTVCMVSLPDAYNNLKYRIEIIG